jgi:alpha-galactosidase
MSRRRFKKIGFCLLMLGFLLPNLLIGITINPTKTLAEETSNVYEAEASVNTLLNGASIGDCASCSAGKKVNNLGNGAVIINHINVPASGNYAMNVYYIVGDNARSFYYTVNNNGDVVNLTTPSTGSWSTVGSVKTTIALTAGDNTIKFDKAGGYAPDLDRITISIAPITGSGENPSEPVIYPNSNFVNMINGNVKIEYDLNNGVANYYASGVKKIANFYAGVQLDSFITSKNYTTRSASTSGSETTITLEGSGLPTMKQHFYMVNEDYFNTLVEVDGVNLRSNWIAPLVVDPTGNVDIGKYSDARALWVPFDNDAWVSYNAMSINSTATSNEVTAFYDNTSRNGLVIGSVVHDTWKTGIYYKGVGNKLINLNVFGGNTDFISTRDVMPHGKVTGNTINSPKVFVGFFMDCS